jgi:hypothetical protein
MAKKHTAFQNNRALIVLSGYLLLAITGCVAVQTSFTGMQASVTGTLPYTPIVSLPEGTVGPTTARLVTIEQVVADPASYADEFVEIHGFNAGYYGKPGCYPYIGPPTTWVLVAAPTTYQNGMPVDHPPRIEIKNTFGGMVDSPSDKYGYAIRNTHMKRVAIWGWVRLYEGGVGCQFQDALGTPAPLEAQKVWYIDAAQLQYLESIDVNRP